MSRTIIANDFSTGATGYIGGSVLTKIVSQFPDIEISALSRSTSQEFSEKYPHVTIVKGTFDDYEVIEKASSKSDIIIRRFFHNLNFCQHKIIISQMLATAITKAQ
jgi:hypothetical protein